MVKSSNDRESAGFDVVVMTGRATTRCESGPVAFNRLLVEMVRGLKAREQRGSTN